MKKKNFKFVSDMFKDRDSRKYSSTKFIGHISAWMLWLFFIEAGVIMWVNGEIDHWIIGELMFFVLTLFGYKNIRKKGSEVTDEEPTPDRDQREVL